jgi:hypothetical protein
VEGQPGLRVDGKVVEAKSVKPAKAPGGANTAMTPDGLHLVATRAGHLEFSNGAFVVRPVLEIKGDVDYSTGNIDFNGDVHVCGDVRENFVIRASGTVTVDGLVEAATVEAGGDLTITRGVVGDNRAVLRSRGCVRVKYLENCVVYAGECVFADCIMTSHIFSDDAICVQTGRGSVIGGALTAAKSIRASVIGSQSGIQTKLTLGELPFVQSELQNIKKDLLAIEQEKRELSRCISATSEGQGLEGNSSKIAKARMRMSVLGIKEQQLHKRKERLSVMEPDYSNCVLECSIVYPVTTLNVEKASWVARDMRRYCKLRFDEGMGEIVEYV